MDATACRRGTSFCCTDVAPEDGVVARLPQWRRQAVAVSERRQETTHRVVCTRRNQISYRRGEPKGFVVARLPRQPVFVQVSLAFVLNQLYQPWYRTSRGEGEVELTVRPTQIEGLLLWHVQGSSGKRSSPRHETRRPGRPPRGSLRPDGYLAYSTARVSRMTVTLI